MTHLLPTTLAEALQLHQRGLTTVICGGTDCYAGAVEKPARHAWLDISRIEALRGISFEPGRTVIGAATPWTQIAAHAGLPPALREAAQVVGSRLIQNRATIGGNVCQASPVADGVPPLVALDAQVELADAGGTSRLPLAEFLLGRRRTRLRAGQLLTRVIFATPTPGAMSAFEKFANRSGSAISVVSVAVAVRWSDTSRPSDARVVIGGASEVPTRAVAIEALLRRAERGRLAECVDDGDGGAFGGALSPIDDLRASASFRHRLARAMVRRACRRLDEGSRDGRV